MKILIFGGNGQLGLELQKRALDLEFEIVSPVQSELDITDQPQVSFLANRIAPNLIINAAAYTAVDQAEAEHERAYSVNRDGAAVVAIAARDVRARLIHVSTDYVFDGEGRLPLDEGAPTNPINVYGASKLDGEREVLRILADKALVVRTSSLHGAKGQNFVHTMIKLLTEKPEISVVNDQIMSPTWAGWLAEAILDLGRVQESGVVHASCAGAISWYDFALAIQERIKAKVEAAGKCVVSPISTAEFPRAARRPAYSVFDCSRLGIILKRAPIPWTEGLSQHLAELGF